MPIRTAITTAWTRAGMFALPQRHKLGPSYRHHLDSEPANRPRLGDRHEDL